MDECPVTGYITLPGFELHIGRAAEKTDVVEEVVAGGVVAIGGHHLTDQAKVTKGLPGDCWIRPRLSACGYQQQCVCQLSRSP